jgi:hypothetical protein
MRRAAKIDANQTQVVTALRAAGAVVHSLAACGNGVPDLLVAFRGQTLLMEIKDGDKIKSAQKLKPKQIQFHQSWTGGPLSVVDSPDAALRAIGCIK